MLLTSELARTLIEEHPIDTSRVLERLSPLEAWAALVLIDAEYRFEIVENFSPEFAARVLALAGTDQATPIIRELPSEIATDILQHLSDDFQRSVLEELPNLHSDEIEALSEYAEDTAGSLMSPEYVGLRDNASVKDAYTRLRRLAMVGRSVNYVYVVDDDDVLKGVLIMRDLVLAAPQTLLKDIMITNIIKAYVDDDIDSVADKLLEEKLLALPVVDDKDRLKGVIAATQLVKDLQEEGFEDVQKMFGAGSDEHASSGIAYTIRQRLPWLQVNLVTAFAAGAVVSLFDSVIAQFTILAAFLPVVAGQGGNAGAQALAVMLRAIALDEVDVRKPKRVLVKEALVGLFNGLIVGLSAGLVAALVGKSIALGLVVTLSMMANLVIAGVSGAAIPLIMERLGQDPAQSSNIILTTVTDIVGFAAFLGLAMLARPWLA
ncbi:MAG: magnesium transporter [Deinococcales bacterium]